MFAFSIDAGRPLSVDEGEIRREGVTEDSTLIEELRTLGQYEKGERYFRAEFTTPETLEEAIKFVHGIFLVPPERVWIGNEMYEVEDEDLEALKTPAAS